MWGTGMVAYGFVREFCGVGISQAFPGLRGMGGSSGLIGLLQGRVK